MNVIQFTVDRVTASAKLNVYQTGTTTPATYYTDPAGTTGSTSQLTADAAGLFAPIYLDRATIYRIKVTNSAGSTTYYDIDPVRTYDEGTEDGVLMVRSVDAAIKRSIPETVSQVYCAGYSDKGDRGQALYVRVASLPTHAGAFTSADGAFWELSENLLNPFMFGAKGDDTTNDSPAIQAMFDFMVTKAKPYPFNFMGAKYYVHDTITLPTIALFVSIDINGGGATLRTDQLITIFERLATSQANAETIIGYCHYDIHHFVFEGTAPDDEKTQIGVHIAAAYTNLVRNCSFNSLNYGSIGTFCLASAWRDNLYFHCNQRAAVLQSATGYDDGTVWSDGGDAESPCNVSVFENCRVFGHIDQVSAFGIFASDAVRMNGCISEGNAENFDVHFDYKGSTTVKNFHVHMLHCEAPTVLNFKVRSSGIVKIDGLVLSRPAAIYDAKGSVNCEVFIDNVAWMGALPVPGGPDTNNPNGRWFYHSNGGGYGGTESGNSSGTQWRFQNWSANAYLDLQDPAKWEAATLPTIVHVRGMTVSGVAEWSNNGSVFKSPVYFEDGTNISGMKKGFVTTTTTTLAANTSVTETYTVTGLVPTKHVALANPRYGYTAPAGLIWTAWVPATDTLKIQYTNTTGSSVALNPGSVQLVFDYCALRAS